MRYALRLVTWLMLCALTLSAAPLHADNVAANEPVWSDRYLLTPGDSINVLVYGEDDLSGPHDVTESGDIMMPLIGAVNVAGLDITEAATAIAAALQDGYLKQPSVTVSMASLRPFYIVGGVREPGEYPYREGLTVLQAIAMGGGYKDYMHGRSVEITRRCGHYELTQRAPIDGTLVLPGDVLKISARRRYHE